MRGTVLYGPRDVRIDERPDPSIVDPTDAVIRIGSFAASDNTCPHCRAEYQTSCTHRQWDPPTANQVPDFLAVSDVLGTGWFAADAANVKPGATVVVVGDGAVGLLGVLSAKQMGAERLIAISRHEARQKLAREFGATDIVTERGDEGVARIKELTKGVGAESGRINPGKVFDLELPLERVADGYRAMDERRAIKTLLRP